MPTEYFPRQAPASPAVTAAGVPGATGNPVFDYRAGFRRVAGAIQRWTGWAGIVCVLLGACTWLSAPGGGLVRRAAVWELAVGSGLVLFSVAWAFLWRGRLRSGFRKRWGI
jgi:hypothetical protein